MRRRAKKKATEITPYRASEELYQALFEQAVDGMFIADSQGRYVEVNRRGYEMLGYTREEMLSLSMKDLIPAEDLVQDPLQLDELQTGKSLLKERRLRCKDGRLLPVEINARILSDGGFLGMVRDLSKRKQVERELQRSNDLLRAIIEAAPAAIIGLDLDGNVQMVWNPAAEKMLGWKAQEVMGRPLPSVSLEREEEFRAFRERIRSGKTLDGVEVRRQRRDGSPIDYSIYASPLHDAEGRIAGNIAVLVDITRRKEAEEKLRATAEELQRVMASVSDCLWSGEVDEAGNWVYSYYSPAVEKITGHPPAYYLDNPQRWLNTIHPDDRPRQLEAFQRVVRGQSEREEEEYRIIRPDGTMCWVRDCVTITRLQPNRLRVDGVVSDITERKRAEQERLAHLRFLESLDQINRAMQGTNDLEQMMSNVLNVMLTIFDCDRAWLVYPCDPKATSWRVPMERTRPEYPGVLPIGVELPLEPMGATVFRILRAANSPVQFGPGSEHQIPVEMAQGFSLQSFIATALYPKIGQPWAFGLHQCSYPRVWTSEDQRLFQEIGRRLVDGLTSLLSYRNLRESERKLEEAERIAHVGWWDRDYDADHITLSDEACRIFGLPLEEDWHDLAQWHERWQELIHPEDRPRTAQAAAEALQGGPRYDLEYRVVRPSGEVRIVRSQGDVTWQSGRPRRMFGIMQDITKLRQVEDELRRSREAALQFSEQLAALQEVTNQLSTAETSDDLCRQAVQLGRSHLGFDRVSIWFIEERLGIMRGSFGTDERGELRDERNAQVEFRPEGLAWDVFSPKETIALVEHRPLCDHLSREVGEGDNAMAALWDGDEVIGVLSVDNLFTHQPITERQLEVLRLYATTLGHLIKRKRTEEALRASETRFRILVDHAADAFFLHDQWGTILDVNRQACESLGYSRQELIGMTPYEFDMDIDRSFLDQMKAQLDIGEVIPFDTRHRRKDGTTFPVEVRVRPFWQDEQRFAVSLARDITDRKQAQESLTLFRSLIDHTNDAIEVIDPETGRFLDMNEQACRALGYTREEFLTLTVSEINPLVAIRSWQEVRDELRRSGSIVRESQHRRKDGSIFPVEVNINYIHLDHDYILAVVRDITERKQVDEALRASEDRYRALYQENPSMFFTLDAEGTVISVNDFGAGQLGYTKDELEGQPVLEVFYEEDKTAVGEQLKICLQNLGRVYYWQFRKVRKDGRLMWVEEFARAVNGPDGTVYVLVVCQDITTRKQLEVENEKLAAQFYQAQKMEAIGQLAGGIAHDFNNLLVPIIGYIDLNLADLVPESDLYIDLVQVRKAADRAADLTRQILAFSRQQVLELRVLDLNEVIEEFKKMLQRLIGEDIELQTFLTPSLYRVKADKGQLEQVLMNLAINSRDAMPAGGKLTLETSNVFLDEGYVEKYASDLAPGHYVILTVSDTGQGMEAETQKRIFDPFFTTKEGGKGTGLGLATVFGIIKQHQGHIGVYSEPGHGTTFKIYLPKAKDTTQTTPPLIQDPISIYGTETVLVVEDEEMVRKLVCETLAAHGYEVIEAKSPTDCLRLAHDRDKIDLLLTDVIMPELNGKELYQKLLVIHPNSRVLYMSGYTNNFIVHHGVLDEGINFLQKPFTVHHLARKVREVLN